MREHINRICRAAVQQPFRPPPNSPAHLSNSPWQVESTYSMRIERVFQPTEGQACRKQGFQHRFSPRGSPQTPTRPLHPVQQGHTRTNAVRVAYTCDLLHVQNTTVSLTCHMPCYKSKLGTLCHRGTCNAGRWD